MLKTKTQLVMLFLLPFIIGGAFYFVGNRQGYDKGYEAAKNIPQKQFDDFQEYTDLRTGFDKVLAENEKLVNDYNTLIQYANTPQYQPRQSFSCTSTTYGIDSNFTSTNCY